MTDVRKRVEELIEELKDYHSVVYSEYKDIIDEIVKIGEPAVPILISNLKKNSVIPHILAQIGDIRALGPLIKLAQTPGTFIDSPFHEHPWHAAEEAIRALGILGDKRALPFLNRLIRETNIAELYKAAKDAKEWIELKHLSFRLPPELAEKSIFELEELAKDETTAPEVLNTLADHPSPRIRGFVAQNPNTPAEALRRLSKKTGDPDAPISEINVHFQLTRNPNCPPDVLAFIEKCPTGISGYLIRSHPNYRPADKENGQLDISEQMTSDDQTDKENGQIDISDRKASEEQITTKIESTILDTSTGQLEMLSPDETTLVLEPYLPHKYKRSKQRKRRSYVALFSILLGLFLLYLAIVWGIMGMVTISQSDPVMGLAVWIASVIGIEESSLGIFAIYSGTYSLFILGYGINFLRIRDDPKSRSDFATYLLCLAFLLFMILFLESHIESLRYGGPLNLNILILNIIGFLLLITTFCCYPETFCCTTLETKSGSVIVILYNFFGQMNAINRKRFVSEKLVAQLKYQDQNILNPVQILTFRKAIPGLGPFIQTYDWDNGSIDLPPELRTSIKKAIYNLGALDDLAEFKFGLFKYDSTYGLYLWKNLNKSKKQNE